MKNHPYPILLALLTFAGQNAHAQAYAELDINNVRARFNAHGSVAHDVQMADPGMEIPIGSGTHSLYSGGLWIAGTTSDGQLRAAAMMFEPLGLGDFYPGPLTADGTASTTQAVMDAYDAVWTVTREDVERHLAYYNCLADPGCDVAVEFPDGYTVPPSILAWPAVNGSAGYETYLAPFYDFNSDGDYDPSAGDAPCILGDQALFLVFNDAGGPHMLTGSPAIKLEIQAMPFAYNSADPALAQTVFVRYHIINRGTQTLQDTRIGFFNDFDLGNPDDDHIASDPSRNLAYIYNGDDVDEDGLGALGYGAQPPAFGQVLLKGPLLDPDGMDNVADNSLPAWNGVGFGDGAADNERSGMDRFISFDLLAADHCNDPVQTGNYHYYLNGIWKDGVLMTYGGNGYNPNDTAAVFCHFMYPGNGDPVGAGTGGVVQAPWSETFSGVTDHRGLSATGEFTLEPGQHIDLLYAYVFARATDGGPLASVAALQTRVDSITAFANTLPIWNSAEQNGFTDQCADYVLLAVEDGLSGTGLQLFPNPASDRVVLQAPRALHGGTLLLRDATGRIVATQRLIEGSNTLEIAAIARGVYNCEVRTSKGRYAAKLVKE